VLFIEDAVHVSHCRLAEGVQLPHFLLRLLHSTRRQILVFLQLVALPSQIPQRLLQSFQLFLQLVPSDLRSDLVLLHAVEDVLVALRAQSRIHLLVLHFLHDGLDLLDLCLQVMAFILDGPHPSGYEVRFVLVLELLHLFVLDVHADPAAGGLQVHQVLCQL
jgi:hypothetical protein